MERDLQEKIDRRTFLAGCSLLTPGGLISGMSGSSNQATSEGAPRHNGMCIGNWSEVIFRDADSCAYLVELANGDLTIGLGPPHLESVSIWELPELVNGSIPSVIFHPRLSQSGRYKLQERLSQFT